MKPNHVALRKFIYFLCHGLIIMISIRDIKIKFGINKTIVPVYQVKPVNNNNIIISKVGTIEKTNNKVSANNIVHTFEIEDGIKAVVISVIILESDFSFLKDKSFYPILKLVIESKNTTVYYAFLPNKVNMFEIDKKIKGRFGIFIEKNKATTFIKTVSYNNHNQILLDLVDSYFNQ